MRVSQESVTIPKISAEREDLIGSAAVYLVLANGGAVKVNGQDQEIKVAAADLPRGAFQLTGVALWNVRRAIRAAVTDAGLAVFKRPCKDITEIKTP